MTKITETIPYRPLGMIMTMINEFGLQVTHYHEDLIFIEHNAFLLQMGEKGEDVFIWFNVDCDQKSSEEILSGLTEQAEKVQLVISNPGLYKMDINEADETFQLEFIEKTEQ